MTPPPPTPVQKNDNDQLKLLVIFHYILGGFSALGILFLGLHYFIMSSVFRNPHFLSEIEKTQNLRSLSHQLCFLIISSGCMFSWDSLR